MASDYEKAAAKVAGLVGVGSVDCDVEKELCGSFGIRGFPTVKLFGPDVNKKGVKEPTDYQGARTTSAMVNAALALLHDKNVQSVKASTLDTVLAGKKVALLFSKKPKASNLFKALSMQFGDRLTFAIISEKEAKEGAAAKFGVTSYPTLIVVDNGAAPAAGSYSGKLKISDMAAFLDQFAAPKPKRSGGGGGGSGDSKPPPSKPVEYDKKVEEISSPEAWEAKCNAKAGFCAVAFLDPQDDEKRHAKFVSELEKVVEKVYKNARVMWVNGPEHYSLFESFRLGGGFPGFALYQPKLKRVVPFRGTFSAEAITEWIQGPVLKGRPQSFPVDKVEFK